MVRSGQLVLLLGIATLVASCGTRTGTPLSGDGLGAGVANLVLSTESAQEGEESSGNADAFFSVGGHNAVAAFGAYLQTFHIAQSDGKNEYVQLAHHLYIDADNRSDHVTVPVPVEAFDEISFLVAPSKKYEGNSSLVHNLHGQFKTDAPGVVTFQNSQVVLVDVDGQKYSGKDWSEELATKTEIKVIKILGYQFFSLLGCVSSSEDLRTVLEQKFECTPAEK